MKIQIKNGLPCGCVEFYISNKETRNQNIRDGGLTGDFIPFKSWDLMELKMLELLDALFVQSQQRQRIVHVRKCIIYENPEDYDSKEHQEGTSSEGSSTEEN